MQRVAAPAPLCIWYRTEEEEPDGAVYPAGKGQDRIFDDHFACRKRNCSRQHVWDWLKLLLLYLDMSEDSMRFTSFLARGGG
ncbi:MAG TPA: hypothetical protein VNI77_11225 [Nitrososphaera sp.]|nr:hypothetical protein [Nitrososphaera sp.]